MGRRPPAVESRLEIAFLGAVLNSGSISVDELLVRRGHATLDRDRTPGVHLAERQRCHRPLAVLRGAARVRGT